MSRLVTKQRKYITHNPISRFLVARFFREISRLIARSACESVLEIGCGEGVLLHHLRPQLARARIVALDIDRADVTTALCNSPFANYAVASAYALPFREGAFDLAVCCEVLEHLDDPDQALREMQRVVSEYCVVSVPSEPIWRVLNLLRGAYVRQWGNTPGHVNHWSHKTFRLCLERYFDVVETVHPLPWTGALCAKRRGPH